MKTKKYIVLFFIACLGYTQAKTNPEQAKTFIDRLISQGINYWANKPYEEQLAKLKEVMETEFDINKIARTSLGEAVWKHLDATTKKDYLQSFRKMIIDRYSAKLSQYNQQKFKVIRASTQPDGDVAVRTEMVERSSSIAIEWIVNQGPLEKFLVTDIILEGVSMITTQRGEFLGFLRQSENRQLAQTKCKAQGHTGGALNKCLVNELIKLLNARLKK